MLIFITVLQLIVGLILTAIVLFQSGKSQGLSGTIGGIADSYMAKSKAKSLDAKLAKMTKWFALGFVVLTLVLNLMAKSGIGKEVDTATQGETEIVSTEAEPEA